MNDTTTLHFNVRQGHVDLSGYSSHEAAEHIIDVETYLDDEGITRYAFAAHGLKDLLQTLGVKEFSFK